MATVVQSYTSAGSATKPVTLGVPTAQVVALTDGEGNVIIPTAGSSAQGVANTTVGGSTTAAVAAGAGTVTIKNSPGRLCRVIVTGATGTGTVTFFDNASAGSGTIIGFIPGSPTTQVFDLQTPAANGITVVAATSSTPVTVSYY